MAFNKPTTQSSTLRYRDNNPTDPFSWDSHLAVDGRKYTRVSSAVVRTPLCSATDDGAMPAWWQVDLVSTYEIQQIAIYGRATVPPGRTLLCPFIVT